MNNLPCIICEKVLEPTTGESQNHIQPNDGIICESYGNYGSKIYDSAVETIDRRLIFNMCDECLIKVADKGLIAEETYDRHIKEAARTTVPYGVPESTKIWVDSETHEEYHQKLKEAGLDGSTEEVN